MTEPNRQSGENEERIIEIEIERLRPFKEHPFQVKDDKEMFLLQESINDCITFFVTIGKGIVAYQSAVALLLFGKLNAAFSVRLKRVFRST